MNNKEFEIIPAIDLLDDKVTMLTQFEYKTSKQSDKYAIDVALEIEKNGLKCLHLIDLNGAKDGYNKNLDILKNILEKTNLQIDFGGGLRTRNQVENILNMGVKYVNISSLAIDNPNEMLKIIEEFGPENFSIGLDVKRDFCKSEKDYKENIDKYMCYTNGGRIRSEYKVEDMLEKYSKLGVKRFNVTSMEYDGTLAGIDEKLYIQINKKFPDLEIIASGGLKDKQDIATATKIGCYGIIFGSAFYFDNLKLEDLK